MKCPRCGADDDKVMDSRSVREGAAIRRRRECNGCGYRYTTYEEVDRDDVTVIKRDGRRQPFSRTKLEKGVRVACQKRPVSEEQIRTLLDKVVDALEGEEVSAARIGELVMERLHDLDEVAYIRFASVYRRFADVKEFLAAVTEMAKLH